MPAIQLRILLGAVSRYPSRLRRASAAAALVAAALSIGGCVSYEPIPIEPAEILRELEALRWSPPSGGEPPRGGVTPALLAAFAVQTHPALRAARARVGVAGALLVEAGLLPDPEIGWDAMDVLASQVITGSSSSVDALSGFGLMFPLPRPGELDAREGAARWRVEEARRAVAQAEWNLAREVHLAYEEVHAARGLLALNAELVAVLERTAAYYRKARAAGAATALQSSLAQGELIALRLAGVRLAGRARQANLALNALLGLPPATELELAPGAEPPKIPELERSAGELVELAVERRPDLRRLLASYQAAEEEVRLEVKRQLPQISIGTGLALIPGLFTRFNRPAIATAMARRGALRREFEAAVHAVRREIHAAFERREEMRAEVELLEKDLLPSAEESLGLARGALDAGNATLVEILAVQRELVDARTRRREARAELARRTWQLAAASGLILRTANPENNEETR